MVTPGGLSGSNGRTDFTPEGRDPFSIDKDGATIDSNGDLISSCNSFPTGTPVLMGDGSHQTIDQIEPGDFVMSYSFDTESWQSREVLDQWSHLDDGAIARVTLSDGSQVSATDDHLFWVES